KLGGTGENFPGELGKIKTLGEGRTRVFRGASVVTVNLKESSDYATQTSQEVIEMSGAAADMGFYGKLQNVVLVCRPADGVATIDYHNALKLAGLRTAVYLAEATAGNQADEIENYDIGPLARAEKGLEHLPRIAYIYQVRSLQSVLEIPAHDGCFYGDNMKKILPTIVHPNEILDGAIIKGYRNMGQETYTVQNHPVVLGLYGKHGKELCFAGVVITVATYTEPERERFAAITSKLVKWVLGADGVILTKIGGGAPHVDLGQTLEQCEKLGVKTAAIVNQEALIFNTPLANAIVNTGRPSQTTLPAVKKVIGGPMNYGGKPAEGEIKVSDFNGTASQIGASKFTMREV
ncbi:MAG: glycine/sarcosine/betaine reductase component B subunit, partial [Chloroflexota bacterium]